MYSACTCTCSVIKCTFITTTVICVMSRTMNDEDGIIHDLRKMFIVLVWNDQQSFTFTIYPSRSFVCVKYQSIASLLNYSIVLMTSNYTCIYYITVYIKSSYPNFKVNMICFFIRLFMM